MRLVPGSFYTSERLMQQEAGDNKQISYIFLKTHGDLYSNAAAEWHPPLPNTSSNAMQSLPSYFTKNYVQTVVLQKKQKYNMKKHLQTLCFHTVLRVCCQSQS